MVVGVAANLMPLLVRSFDERGVALGILPSHKKAYMRTTGLEPVEKPAGIGGARAVIKSERNELRASDGLRIRRHYPDKQQNCQQHGGYLCKFSHIPFPEKFLYANIVQSRQYYVNKVLACF